MNKAIKIIALCALLIGTPAIMTAEELYDGPETETTAITLSVNGSVVRICGAAGETLDVYNLTGKKVASYRIDSAEKTITLNQTRGCYILKVGNVARKVSIR